MLMLRKTGTHMRRKRRRRALVLPWRIVSLWRVAHVRRRRRRVVLRRHLLRVCPRWLSRAWGRASCGVLRMTGVMLRMSWMLLLAHVGRGRTLLRWLLLLGLARMRQHGLVVLRVKVALGRRRRRRLLEA
jgi:hypothetical protein